MWCIQKLKNMRHATVLYIFELVDKLCSAVCILLIQKSPQTDSVCCRRRRASISGECKEAARQPSLKRASQIWNFTSLVGNREKGASSKASPDDFDVETEFHFELYFSHWFILSLRITFRVNIFLCVSGRWIKFLSNVIHECKGSYVMREINNRGKSNKFTQCTTASSDPSIFNFVWCYFFRSKYNIRRRRWKSTRHHAVLFLSVLLTICTGSCPLRKNTSLLNETRNFVD